MDENFPFAVGMEVASRVKTNKFQFVVAESLVEMSGDGVGSAL